MTRLLMSLIYGSAAFSALLMLLVWCDHLGGDYGRFWMLVMLMVNVAVWCGRDTAADDARRRAELADAWRAADWSEWDRK